MRVEHSDDGLWNVVAFLEKLPGMIPDDYQKLKVAVEAAGGHNMHGRMEMRDDTQSGEPQPRGDH